MVNSHQLRAPKNTNLHPNSRNSSTRQGEGGHHWKKITSEACQTHSATLLLATGLWQWAEQAAADGMKKQETEPREFRYQQNKGEVAEGSHLRGEEGHLCH